MKKAYVVKKAGYLFGSYIAEGTELMLTPRQAKYPALSGQLEPVEVKMGSTLDVPKKAPRVSRRRGSERSTKRTVGASFGGSYS